MDMLLTLDPPEILALGTPKLSHGTKIFWSKFFLPYNNYIIFYAFCWLVVQKMAKTANNRSFTSNLLLQPKSARITWFFQFLHFFAKPIHKMHEISSYYFDVCKILTENFWSHGTLLGYPGSGYQADLGLGACPLQILIIWGPYESLVPLELQGQAKKLKRIPPWCASHHMTSSSWYHNMSLSLYLRFW